jgi:hypothetical protein
MGFFGNFKENIQKIFHKKDAPFTDSSSSENKTPLSSEITPVPRKGSRDLKNEISGPSETSEITSAKSLFKVKRTTGDTLEFRSLFNDYPFFSANAVITGDLANFFGEKDASGIIPSIVEVPLDEGKILRVQTFIRAKIPPSADYQVSAASQKIMADGARQLTFTFSLGPDEITIEFLLPPGLPCNDFREVIETKKVFEQIPPVSHMGMLLKTYILVEKPGVEKADMMSTLMKMAAGIPNDRASGLLSEVPGLIEKLACIDSEGIDFLSRYLGGHDIHIHPSHLASLCAFLEMETGNITRDNWEKLGIVNGRLPISPYSIMAITDALGFKLRAFELDRKEPLETPLQNLLSLAQGGIIAEVEEEHQSSYSLLTSLDQIRELEASASSFSGIFLAQISFVEHLTNADLDTLLRTRRNLMACYQSDFDKRMTWRKIHLDLAALDETEGPALTLDRGAHHFYKGFRSFQFMKTVLGKIVPESPLADIPQGSVVIHRDSRGSRQYGWVEDEKAFEMYQKSISSDWTFADEKLILPDVESLPEYMAEARLHRLLGREEKASPEELALTQLQPRLSSLLTQYPHYIDIFEDAGFAKKMSDCIRGRESILLKYMNAKTLEAMLKYIQSAEVERKLNIKINELLFRDWQNQVVLSLSSYFLMSSLCLSSYTETRGYFKSFDDKNFRFFLRNTISELIDSPEGRLRKLALSLLATSNIVANRSDLLMAEYDIERGIKDQDAGVRDCALSSRLALIMRKKIPLASPVIVEPTEALPVIAKPGKSNIWEEKLSKDITTLLGKIDEYVEGASNSDKRTPSGGLDSTSADLDASMIPFVGSAENRKNMSRLIVGVNEALKTSDFDKNRYLFVVSRHQFENLMESVIEIWKEIEKREGMSFATLLGSRSKEALMESFLKAGRERSLDRSKSLPFFGGPHSVMIHRVEPQKIIKAIKTIENKKVSIRRKKVAHKFFIDLVVMGAQFGLKNLRICRARRAGGEDLDELENTLTTFTTSREIHAHDLEVFNYQLARFIPFFHLLNMKTQHFSDDDRSWELVNLLLGFYDSFLKAPADPSACDQDADRRGSEGEGESPQIAGSSSDIIEISRQVARAFALPESSSRQVMNIIFEAAPQCIYDIWG